MLSDLSIPPEPDLQRLLLGVQPCRQLGIGLGNAAGVSPQPVGQNPSQHQAKNHPTETQPRVVPVMTPPVAEQTCVGAQDQDIDIASQHQQQATHRHGQHPQLHIVAPNATPHDDHHHPDAHGLRGQKQQDFQRGQAAPQVQRKQGHRRRQHQGRRSGGPNRRDARHDQHKPADQHPGQGLRRKCDKTPQRPRQKGVFEQRVQHREGPEQLAHTIDEVDAISATRPDHEPECRQGRARRGHHQRAIGPPSALGFEQAANLLLGPKQHLCDARLAPLLRFNPDLQEVRLLQRRCGQGHPPGKLAKVLPRVSVHALLRQQETVEFDRIAIANAWQQDRLGLCSWGA